ncbi:MAG: hypothetical protein A3J63_00810 [Candidatus Moranbacteria bacterium RIFCSPHIGHO2_02_FULL_40_12b]|nr:MAG: hypothetical protein A3J63_00810 [Candidatus Moranbacteria bacterium RIFCSPHIGHO2_02_FULL_40_12b]
MKEVLIKVNELLRGKLKWAIFGSVAVAIYNRKFYRECEDIDIIIEDDVEKIINLFKNYEVCFKYRNGRKRGYLKIDNIAIELLFLTTDSEINLADGKFKFNKIEEREFNGINLSVVDLQSLYCAKLRHKQVLEEDKDKKTKLENTDKDLDILKKLISI